MILLAPKHAGGRGGTTTGHHAYRARMRRASIVALGPTGVPRGASTISAEHIMATPPTSYAAAFRKASA